MFNHSLWMSHITSHLPYINAVQFWCQGKNLETLCWSMLWAEKTCSQGYWSVSILGQMHWWRSGSSCAHCSQEEDGCSAENKFHCTSDRYGCLLSKWTRFLQKKNFFMTRYWKQQLIILYLYFVFFLFHVRPLKCYPLGLLKVGETLSSNKIHQSS